MLRKPISGFPGYFVCENGDVFGPKKQTPLKPGLSGSGYYFVILCNGWGQVQTQVHRLVAVAFCSGSGADVNHKNGIKTDNRAENLEWCSRSDNQRHAADIGLKPSGEDSHLNTKLNAADVVEIRRLCAAGWSQQRVANLFGISQTFVGKIKNRKKWRQIL